MTIIDLSLGPVTLTATPTPGPAGPAGPSGMGVSVPGGRLTLVSSQPVMKSGSDYSSATLYYAPFESDKIPLFDGTSWGSREFTSGPLDSVGASMTGGSAWAINTSRDVFLTVFDDVVRLVTGPVWPSEALSDRGLVRRNGLFVNAGSIVLDLSAVEQTTVPEHQATYVGSISIGATAGLLKATFAIGQNRTCDVWNFYHQQPIKIGVGCPPVPPSIAVVWSPSNLYTVTGFLPFNNDAKNCGDYFTGMPQDVESRYLQRAFLDTLNKGLGAVVTAICKNTYSNVKGTWGTFTSDVANLAVGVTVAAEFVDLGTVGRQRVYMAAANANDTGPIAVTLWGLVNVSGRSPEDTHVMWIKYQG